MDYERWTQIDRHNHELLTRMDKIMMSRGHVDHINDYKAKPWLVCGWEVYLIVCVCMLACSSYTIERAIVEFQESTICTVMHQNDS